jgi:uncharacterized membrane protein YgcG
MKKILLSPRRIYVFSFFFFLFSLSGSVFAAEFVVPPAPTGHILDEVGILDTTDKTTLENTLVSLEQETHHQVAIAILKSLQGRTIEEV